MDPLGRALKNDAPETFGERLAVALVQVKLPGKNGKAGRPYGRQGWLAQQAGFKRQQIHQWLNDQCEPGLDRVRRLARVLGVNPGWLAFGCAPIRFRNPLIGPTGMPHEKDR